MEVEVIRSRLKSGDTIDEVCREYHLTFEELVCRLHRQPSGSRISRCSELYITVIDGRYVLRKNNVYYGSYSSLGDAKKVRDYFILHRWDKRKIDSVCEMVGVKRLGSDGV